MFIFAAFNAKEQKHILLVVAYFFATYLSAVICKDIKAINSVLNYSYYRHIICSLARIGGDSLSYIYYFNFSLVQMPKNNENYSSVNNSTATVTHRRAKSAPIEPTVQVIHQIIIPEHPSGLIGEKVVFSEKYLQKYPNDVMIAQSRVSTPYFTIIDAWTEMREKGIIVMIKPDIPGTQWKSHGIALSYFKKYECHA